MAPIRAGGGRRHRGGLRADRSSAIAQRRGDPCPQSHLSKAKSISYVIHSWTMLGSTVA